MQLYFNIIKEKQSGINSLREIIILNEEREIQNYKIIRDSLLNLNKFHENSEVRSILMKNIIDLAL